MMKGQCMPRLKSNSSSCSTKNKSPTPMTLLERFREAVLRLMMLSALSRATTNRGGREGGGGGGGRQQPCYSNSHSPYDPHHSEAVADCIEFIKKKANSKDDTSNDDDDNRPYSSASCSPDQTAEFEILV